MNLFERREIFEFFNNSAVAHSSYLKYYFLFFCIDGVNLENDDEWERRKVKCLQVKKRRKTITMTKKNEKAKIKLKKKMQIKTR